MVKYSVIVTFYNNRNLLKFALGFLLQRTPMDETEIIVVNDNPTIRLNDICEDSRVRIVTNQSNLGYSGACNKGADVANGTELVFCDADVLPTDGWLTRLLRTRAAHPACGSAAAKILSMSNGMIFHFGIAFHEVDIIKPFQGNIATHPFTVVDRKFQAITSGLMLINRDLFLRTGGFDTKLMNADGDLDLSCRLNAMGYETWVSSECIAYHRGKISGPVRLAFRTDAKALFFRKWGQHLRGDAEEIFRFTCRIFKTNMAIVTSKYLGVNLSNTIFYRDYFEFIGNELNLEIVNIYNFPTFDQGLHHISLEGHLSPEISMYKLPILYFVDSFSTQYVPRYRT